MLRPKTAFSIFAFLLAGALFCFSSVDAAEKNEWTINGTLVLGTWEPSKDPSADGITLRDSNGKTRFYELESLLEEDREYVKSRREELDWRPEPQPLRIFALLVGVAEYDNYKRLLFPVNDVEMIRDQLVALNVPPENIILLRSDGTDAEKPTKSNIERELERLIGPPPVPQSETDGTAPANAVPETAPLVQKEDLLFIALAGHGVQIGNTPYFMPSDTPVGEKPESVADSLVSLEQLQKRVAESKATFKWLFIDACRSGAFPSTLGPGSSNLPQMQSIASPPPGMVTMLACAPGNKSYEPEKLEHGCFSKAFVDGLKGGADLNNDGSITFFELWSYLSSETTQLAWEGEHATQRPSLMANQISEFIVVQADTEAADPDEEMHRLAERLYQESFDFLMNENKPQEALEKIGEALKIEPENAMYDNWKKLLVKKFIEDVSAVGQQDGPFRSGAIEPGQKQTLPVNGVNYTFCWCPPGLFKMGYSPGGTSRAGDDSQHQVLISRGFWLLETEVTQEMWNSVMGDGPKSPQRKSDNPPRYPVSRVSWNDAKAFCEKLCELSSQHIQLPTEAQWEYACRAGSGGDYGGSDRLDDIAWYKGNSDRHIHEVATKTPNAWRLRDMHGNLQEWCSDFYKRDYYLESPIAIDPAGPERGDRHVFRGGSFANDEENCLASGRRAGASQLQTDQIGFRIALIP